MYQNEKMRDFVESLENNQLSSEQEALLLVGGKDKLHAGKNGSCENRSSSCDFSINRRCTNGTEKGCGGSINRKECSRITIPDDDDLKQK